MARLPLAPRASLALALAVPAAAVLELALHLGFARGSPTPADWQAARPRLLALRERGDAVLIAPWWAEPHARMALGEELLPLRDVARPDESRYRRVVEVGALGERLPGLEGWRVLSEERLAHALTARVLENPAPVRVTYDFTDALEAGRAEVAWRSGEGEQPCPFRTSEPVAAPGLFGHPAMPPRRHVCGALPWQSVGVTVQDDERFHARRCIWSHPPPTGEVRVRFRDVPLGAQIRGHMGIHWTLERERRGRPVDIEVEVDGEPVGSARHEDGQGWALFSVPLGPHAQKTAREVLFRLHTSDPNERQICWEADSR